MRCLAFTSYPVISFLCCDRSRLRSGPRGTGWLDLRYSGMPGSRSLFFPWGQASAVAIYGTLGNGSCFPLSGWARRAQAFWPDRAFASVGRKPPTTAAFLVGPDAAGVGVLAGPRARPRRADRARPSSFPPPLARPFFFLDVDRPFLPSVAHSSLR